MTSTTTSHTTIDRPEQDFEPKGSVEFVVMSGAGYGYWGKGDTLADAKQEFKRQGGRLNDGYAILTFSPESLFSGINSMGSYLYFGPEPTIEYKQRRKS